MHNLIFFARSALSTLPCCPRNFGRVHAISDCADESHHLLALGLQQLPLELAGLLLHGGADRHALYVIRLDLVELRVKVLQLEA